MKDNWAAWNIWLIAACVFGGLGWFWPMIIACVMAVIHIFVHVDELRKLGL